MKKVINGFDVEVIRATLYHENILSILSFNIDSKEWQVDSTVNKIGLIYTVNNVLEIGNEYYRPENSTYLPKAFEREAAEAKALGLDISVEDLKAIDTGILTDFFSKTPSMLSTDLQYYEGKDDLSSLDKSIQHKIQLIPTDIYFYKDLTFRFMPCTLAGEKVLSKLVINNEAVDFTVDFDDIGGLIDYEDSKFYPFLETLLGLDKSDGNIHIRQHIEHLGFEHCLEFYQDS